jgi:hypothetical protein
MVAELNRLEDSQLEAFLFGADRVQTARIPEDQQLGDLARLTAWEREPDKSASVARGIYLRLPADARLWLRRREFVDPDGARLAAALAGPSGD